MNLTINALALRLILSGLALSHQNFIMTNSQLSYSFNHFIYGNNLRHFKAFHSTFSHFLSTPIILRQSHTFSFQYFTESQSLNTNSDYEFISNIFYKCTSDSKGGGIHIYCDPAPEQLTSSITVKSNCFTECQSTQGGAFYIICSESFCQENTFRNCQGGYFSIFNLDTQSQVSFEQNHIINTKNTDKARQHSTAISSQKLAIAKNLNISSNSLDLAHDIFLISIPSTGLRTEIQCINFLNCISNSIFYVKGLSSSTIERTNFIRNTGLKYLLDIGSFQLKLIDCSFIEDHSPVLSSRYIIYDNCVFDLYRNQVNFSAYYTVTNCEFHELKSQAVNVKTEPNCVRITSNTPNEPDQTNEKDSGSIAISSVLGIAAAICIAILVITAFKRKMCAKKQDSIPLMYV